MQATLIITLILNQPLLPIPANPPTNHPYPNLPRQNPLIAATPIPADRIAPRLAFLHFPPINPTLAIREGEVD
jgi:hypothetical protein